MVLLLALGTVVLAACGAYILAAAVGYGATRILLPDDPDLETVLRPWIGFVLSGIFLTFFGFAGVGARVSGWFALAISAALIFWTLRTYDRETRLPIKRTWTHAAAVVIATTILMLPIVLRSRTMTSLTIGNLDIVDYVMTASWLTDHGLKPFLNPFGRLPEWEDATTIERVVSTQIPSPRWLSYYFISLFSSLTGVDPARLFTLHAAFLTGLFLPAIWILARRIAGLSGMFLTLGFSLAAANPHFLYILYNAFLPQVAATGLFACVLAVIAGMTREPGLQPRKIALAGILLAGVLACYPELFSFAALSISLIFAWFAWTDRPRWKTHLGKLFMTLGLAAALCPYQAFRFFPIMLMNTGGFGGWNVTSGYYSFFFQLGGFFSHPFLPKPVQILEWTISPALLIMAASGIWKSRDRTFWILVLLPFAISGTVSYLSGWNYRYFKNATYFYFLVPMLAARGLQEMEKARFPWKAFRQAGIGMLILMTELSVLKSAEAVWVARKYYQIPMEFAELRAVNRDPQVKRIFFEGMAEWEDSWIGYFLKDKILVLPEPRVYLRNEMPAPDRKVGHRLVLNESKSGASRFAVQAVPDGRL